MIVILRSLILPVALVMTMGNGYSAKGDPDCYDIGKELVAIERNVEANDNVTGTGSIEEDVKVENNTNDITVVETNHDVVYSNNGTGLTKSKGVYYFGDQKETYYNLDMSRVVASANANGIAGEYSVREDGCKMLGGYIMIAANYSVHPYGSLVETSLGTGIVVDTGGFADANPNQIDIATNW